MNIAYISHHGRYCYEQEWFSEIPCTSIKFLDTDFSRYPKITKENMEYCTISYTENVFFNRFFHSTASIISYSHFEKHLKNIDIVIVLEVFSSLSFQFTQYCKANNIKIVALVYELIPSHPIYKLPFFSRNTRYVLENSDAYICVSEEAKNHLRLLGGDEKKTHIISPGINISKFPISQNTKETVPLYFLGKLERHKGIDLFLLLAKSLLNKYHNKISITIIGQGSFESEVQELCSLFPNNTHFQKHIDNGKISEKFHSGGIYILPARDTYKWGIKIGSEQFCFSIVEAMACENAIVSTHCGAISSVATSNNFISEQGNIQSIEKQVSRLIEDKSLRTNIATKNRTIVEKQYNIKNQAVDLYGLLKTIT